jgi:hypothetical protein
MRISEYEKVCLIHMHNMPMIILVYKDMKAIIRHSILQINSLDSSLP